MPARLEGKVRLRLRGFRKYFDREVSKDDAKLRRQLVLLNAEVSAVRDPDSGSLVVNSGGASTWRKVSQDDAELGRWGWSFLGTNEREAAVGKLVDSRLPTL